MTEKKIVLDEKIPRIFAGDYSRIMEWNYTDFNPGCGAKIIEDERNIAARYLHLILLQMFPHLEYTITKQNYDCVLISKKAFAKRFCVSCAFVPYGSIIGFEMGDGSLDIDNPPINHKCATSINNIYNWIIEFFEYEHEKFKEDEKYFVPNDPSKVSFSDAKEVKAMRKVVARLINIYNGRRPYNSIPYGKDDKETEENDDIEQDDDNYEESDGDIDEISKDLNNVAQVTEVEKDEKHT